MTTSPTTSESTAAMSDEIESCNSSESPAWETEIAELLSMLSAAQGEMLALLSEKRELLRHSDVEGLNAIAPREESLVVQLQACQSRRAELLQRAAGKGLPSDSIQSLSGALGQEQKTGLKRQFSEAAQRSRLLEHHSLTNWVLVQKTLLHLSQMLEIIATGGQPMPTYSKGSSQQASGALVDRAA